MLKAISGADSGGSGTFTSLTVNGIETINAAVPITAATNTGALIVNATINAAGFPAANANPSGIYFNTTLSGNGSLQDTTNDTLGLLSSITVSTTGTLARVKAFQPSIYMNGAGTISDAEAVFVHMSVDNAATIVTSLYGFAPSVTQNLGSIGTYIDFYSRDFSAIPGVTAKYSLYNDDAGKIVYNKGRYYTPNSTISSAAWTTNGLGIVVQPTLNDTTSSGTVANIYNNYFNNTNTATSVTTYTNAYGYNFETPTAGTNVTFTNAYAARFGGSTVTTGNARAAALVPTSDTIPTMGIYGASSVNVASSGVRVWTLALNLTANNGSGPQISGANASATVPTLIPNRADATTGIGAQASGNISLTVGAAEIARVVAGGLTVISGKALTLGNAATTALTPGVLAASTNASIIITDSGGQAYRIPCII